MKNDAPLKFTLISTLYVSQAIPLGFFIVAAAVFVLIKQVNRIKSAMDDPSAVPSKTTKDCPFCASTIY